MGAEQSSARGSSNAQIGDAKTCYYEVLGVERQATEDDIKKAYRRKALELHPDRNYGDTESATVKFAEVQSAYQVLSDPQERAWYDAHRESILRGGDGEAADEHFERNVRLTSARDIVGLISRFNPSIPFTDASNGFFGILQGTFATLAREEAAACDWEGREFLAYPDFGGPNDDYESVVKAFYGVWINFSTQKTYAWNDAYRPSDAPDRRTRRLIEKENKRLRDEGIREFNDAVRSLVAFVRKRDPRYTANAQSMADREKVLRDAAAAQRARSRAANQAKLNQHVATVSGPIHEAEESLILTESEEESDVEHIECVVCRKTFKSEKQYEAHEKSKKHIKAVQHLQREMRKENKLFNLDIPLDTGPTNPVVDFEKLEIDPEVPQEADKHSEHSANADDYASSSNGAALEVEEKRPSVLIDQDQNETSTRPLSTAPRDESSDSLDSGDEYASRRIVEGRLSGSPQAGISSRVDVVTATTAPSIASENDEMPKQKLPLGKAKAKRAKKAARQETAEQEGQFKCAVCNDSFASKTKLFNHIKKEPDHAQPIARPTKGKNKKL